MCVGFGKKNLLSVPQAKEAVHIIQAENKTVKTFLCCVGKVCVGKSIFIVFVVEILVCSFLSLPFAILRMEKYLLRIDT